MLKFVCVYTKVYYDNYLPELYSRTDIVKMSKCTRGDYHMFIRRGERKEGVTALQTTSARTIQAAKEPHLVVFVSDV